MKTITNIARFPRALAVLTAATIGLSSVAANADENAPVAYDNITVTEQVSAYAAKRLARRYLVERGFATGVGPGKAAIDSITRDGDTWVLRLAISDGGWVMNRSAVLYIDANTAAVSESEPETNPERVAGR